MTYINMSFLQLKACYKKGCKRTEEKARGAEEANKRTEEKARGVDG